MKTRFMNFAATTLPRGLLVCLPLLAAGAAHAQSRDALADLINEYRADPGSCGGWRADPAPPLAPHPALARARVAPGGYIDDALERAGYPVAEAKIIYVSGARNAEAAMDAVWGTQCRALLGAEWTSVGTARSGDSWQIVLARQSASPHVSHLSNARVARQSETRDIGKLILDAVNRARATPRNCGTRHFDAARPLTWNRSLASAAQAHSSDMARQSYFSHQGRDGSEVSDRAKHAGYRYLGIGENIAAGQKSADEVMAGWLASPGHCANIMDRWFTEMGSAYALGGGGSNSHPYWTQVFGTPK
ncbi:CAP domain-containing protein [Massilia sp. R2A-15]|uniref:CAP domain-containing protein n=1 Tax=Massilia sp. R2A-15 TaxID=3064278 RepID=UPI00273726C6|nr:CAP domain-containing protein [Massilia sp. R2A-15]WLI90545.1 CAP domain-containing protein [Massilia sp. R2A-15]